MCRNAEPVASHQPAGRVEQGKFAAAIGLGEAPLDLQRGTGAALVAAETITNAGEAQVGLAMPSAGFGRGDCGGQKSRRFGARCAAFPGLRSPPYRAVRSRSCSIAVRVDVPIRCPALHVHPCGRHTLVGHAVGSQPPCLNPHSGRSPSPGAPPRPRLVLRSRRCGCPSRPMTAPDCAAIAAASAVVIWCCSWIGVSRCSRANGSAGRPAIRRCGWRPLLSP